ncbi:MAG TPA: AI-2E family transporter [Gemmatimonadota bacterium]|nr:AI-2E family transporter [Gemmatimonadota bacterium]
MSERAEASTSAEAGRDWVHQAVVVAAFAVLAVSVRSVLSPFVLYLLFLYLVWPRLSRSVLAVRLAAAGTALMALWVAQTAGLLLAPFVLALLAGYVLDPVVDWMQARGLGRSPAVWFLSLPLLGVLALLVFVVAPAVTNQVSQLIANVPTYLHTVESWADQLRAWVVGLGIRGLDESTVPRLRDVDAQALVQYLQQRQSRLAEGGLQAVLGLGKGIGAVLTVAGYLVLLPILAYYLLRDWDGLRARLAELVPPAVRPAVLGFAAEYDRLLGRYLRGQLLLATCVGIIIGVGFWIVGFPYALLLGLLAGVLNFVPYLGLLASLAAAVLIALFSGHFLGGLFRVAIVFGAEQVLESILGPRIVGQSVGLHPVWVILALALFSFFFGFVGLLLAVPAAVFLKLVLSAALRRYRASRWFRGGAAGPAGDRSGGVVEDPGGV